MIAPASSWVLLAALTAAPPVTVGSKKFTESVILGELARQLLHAADVEVGHRRELGGTRILWDALLAGDIDAYPEYDGTLRAEIFAGEGVGPTARDLEAALAADGVGATAPLGFDDTYAIGMREADAARLGIGTLSELAAHPELVLGLSHEFLDREDGWPGLARRYGLTPDRIVGLDHDVAYRALATGQVQAIDLYSTDAEIRRHALRLLRDDRGYFPAYQAIFVHRLDLAARHPGALAALRRLEGRIDVAEMTALNAAVMLDRRSECAVAADFLAADLGVSGDCADDGVGSRVWRRTVEHGLLVAVTVLSAVLVALPIGVLCFTRRRLGGLVLAAVGALQTVPSLALLVLFIPLLGIGVGPAVAAMFLYSLLPIVRNTATGLGDIDPRLRESAQAIGLSRWAQLWRIELPLASRAILAGVRTSAVISVSTATIGALVGAGGYGQPILTGIRLADTQLILEGALPAAAMAWAIELGFGAVERVVVPRGLRP